ncbi:histidine kinase dimerization/phospho-acceptor domain-containing protein [Paraburkholderia sp.]|uniref:histidine kinase dimerization/phospho-acceptor domain-containing protein n=1 Tax=Paraburkholderia sp. TaxID=1926495 RepID=UPI00238A45B5|nr:histidine kinase dimerization/phospho-acceptor domain-containing protein [Paraburkholderia sp.]MDE1179945.1 GAF domain-containing protein [Paraburkholderia sp.]
MDNNEQLPEIVANCDQEPIHALGFIQPHGALLGFDRDGRLLARSANATEWLGPLPELGEPVTDAHLSPLSRQTLRAALADPHMPLESVECKGVRGDRFDLVLHWSGEMLIAEFEQLALNTPAASQFALYAQRAIQRLQANDYADPASLLQATAEAIRAMTGFDRVMGYRFLLDGSGEVLGEARRDDLPPYMHQRYPAGDIPAQARRLYVLNPIRQIASVDAPPVPIEPPLHPRTNGAYDLSYSVLRSVSPIHIEYLKNMGVGASMSVSIIVNGKLWGLFACHHMTAYRASHAVRLSCTVLTQVVSILIAQIEARQRALNERRVHELRTQIASELMQADDPLAGLAVAAPEVASLLASEAVMAIVDREVIALGRAPVADKDSLWALAEHMANSRQDLLATSSLSADLPTLGPLRTLDGDAAGCLAIQMLGDARITIVWLRDELVETINWAGPPDKVIARGPNGVRLTPRGSFEVWKQTVRGRSREWTEMDQFAARELKAILQDVALHRMREAERARTTLLATLGHDLRNPLQAINMAVQLMGRGLATSNDTAKRVEGSTRRMQSLINYILDVSRIRSGVGLGLSREQVGLKDLLESTVEQNRLTHPGITITTQWADDLGQAFVDQDRFHQALGNLISNARQHGDMKYPIELIAHLDDASTTIEVRNRVIAKPAMPFERLTDPFKSGSLGNPNNRGGLGLGLYIASAIVKGHGAELSGNFTETEARIRIALPR